MMRWSVLKDLKEKDFIRATGINFFVFHSMVEVIEDVFAERKYPGRPSSLSIEDQLLLTLFYYREYITLFKLGLLYGLSESQAAKVIYKIEAILMQTDEFKTLRKSSHRLTSPDAVANEDQVMEAGDTVTHPEEAEVPAVLLVDATEITIERPATHQSTYYSGKKKNIR